MRNTIVDLSEHVSSVLSGAESMNTAANRAKVNVSTLRRLVLADPKYSQAVTDGKVATKDVLTVEQMRKSPLVLDVTQGGMTVAQAAGKYGVSEVTVRARVRKAFPNFLQRYSNSGSENETHEPREAGINKNVPPSKGPKLSVSCPLINWETARDYGHDVGAIPNELIEAWMPAARAHSPNAYALRIQDNGMTAAPGSARTFPMGSCIFVDSIMEEPREGDRVIAKLTGMNMLVFRIYHAGPVTPWLEPLNPMFEAIRIPFTVIGKV